MAKSLRSKRRRQMRRERREKFKVKETQRLLETLGVSEAGKGEAMAVAPEEKDSQNVEKDQQNEHVVVEPTKNIQNTDDVEMDQEKTQQNNNTSNKKVDRKQLLKRLGKKRHFKKANKKIKW